MIDYLLSLTLTATVSTATVATPPTDAPPPAVVAAAPAAPADPGAKPPPMPVYLQPGPGLQLILGEWKLKPLLQYWARFIGDTGRDLKDGPFLEYVGQRGRLGLDVAHANGFGVRVLVQDVRTWGEETDTLVDFTGDGLDVQEAYVDLPLFGVAKVRVGRQELVLDEARLIGNVIWTLRARSFDGVRLEGTWDALHAKLFYAKVKERDQNPDGHVPAGVSTDRDLALAYASYTLPSKHYFSLLYAYDGSANDSKRTHTLGPVLKGGFGAFDYLIEAYLQVGKYNEQVEVAFLTAANFGYTLDVPGKLRPFVYLDVVSSDGTPNGTFDTLYATNHKFYGEMDLFLNLPLHTAGLGLINPGAGLSAQPYAKLKLLATYFDFLGYKEDPNLGRQLGHEVDVRAIWTLLDSVQLHALYGVFIAGDAFQKRFGAGNDTTEHFVYTTLQCEI
ncbi:MAG: alginate export family protein [Deltaproteobacteria bacterium]|jgi:hypothetical protein|nr:alginate export family protein [Deltaproteobacteria bacterium]